LLVLLAKHKFFKLAKYPDSFQLILQNVSRHISLNAEEIERFFSVLHVKKYKNKQLILSEGEICYNTWFVTKGCLRGYTTDQNGFEHVLSFAPVDWWIGDIYSLISQKPGTLNIETLEASEAILLHREHQELLYADVPKFERFFRIIIEKSLVHNQQRLIENLSLSAEDRYEKFCLRYPQLVNYLPQKQIASYIGVTPEFFSKMKSRFYKK
jgi:CRP-like cAMP-binding protein